GWESRRGWSAQNWSPAVGAEHLATRERAALFDLTPYVKLDVQAPDALAFLERVCANRIDRRPETVIYTSMLTPSGGIRCDLTVTRASADAFIVMTGGGSGMHELAWLSPAVGDGERVSVATMPLHRDR